MATHFLDELHFVIGIVKHVNEWLDTLAQLIYKSLNQYKQIHEDNWSAIPNYSGTRVFTNGINTVRLGGAECRAILKLQMFVNYGLFPHHDFVVENNILLLEFIKYTHWHQITLPEIEEAHVAWINWAEHTVEHFSQFSKSGCMFLKMHTPSLFKSSVLACGTSQFTSSTPHEQTHHHFIAQVLKSHNGRHNLTAIIDINSRIQCLTSVPQFPQSEKRRRASICKTENYLPMPGKSITASELVEYQELITEFLLENDQPLDTVLSVHNTLQIRKSPIVTTDKVVLSENYHLTGPRSEGAMIMNVPNELNESNNNTLQYYYVVPKKFLSFGTQNKKTQFAIIQNTEILHFPQDHVLKSYHLKLVGKFSIMDICFFAKSAFLITDYRDPSGRSLFVNTFVDYF